MLAEIPPVENPRLSTARPIHPSGPRATAASGVCVKGKRSFSLATLITSFVLTAFIKSYVTRKNGVRLTGLSPNYYLPLTVVF
jgi:hypothetical protein